MIYAYKPLCTVCGSENSIPTEPADNPRESLKCAKCDATARHRAVAAAIGDVNVAPLYRGIRLALGRDPACRTWEMGTSPLSSILNEQTDYVRSELHARPGAVAQNLEATTWPDHRFDLIVCSDVLEHVRLYRRALMELGRVLAPGGAAILTAPDTGADGPHEDFVQVLAADGEDIFRPDTPVHPDPIDPAGCVVYRYYSLMTLAEEIQRLARLHVTITPRDRAEYGVVNCPVVIARKPEA